MQQLADRLSQLAADSQGWQHLLGDEASWLELLSPFARGPGRRFSQSMPPPPWDHSGAEGHGTDSFLPPRGPPVRHLKMRSAFEL